MNLSSSSKKSKFGFSGPAARKSVWLYTAVLLIVAYFLYSYLGGKKTEANGTLAQSPQSWVAEATLPHTEVPHSLLTKIDPGPLQLMADAELNLIKRTETVGSGESLSVVLERLGVKSDESYKITGALKDFIDLTKVRPGVRITVFEDKETVKPLKLVYAQPGKPQIILYRTPVGYAATTINIPPVLRTSVCGGTIKATLWGTAVKLYGLDPELVMNFADVFRYDVDFLTDVRKGDSFNLLYEQKFCDGRQSGSGRILAAEFVNQGEKHTAYYFENKDGKGGYYRSSGQALEKMFLKSPLQYRRISSYFSKSRLHPILKYRRPHLGVDYAAPTGTPVETIGDGRVTFIGRKGGYGKMVIIEHKNRYITQYAHLSAYAKGLKKCSKVKQGQLIGYVGSTGLATGPHLDFRVKKKGVFIDPLSIKSASAPPIAEKDKTRFFALVAQRDMELSRQMAANNRLKK